MLHYRENSRFADLFHITAIFTIHLVATVSKHVSIHHSKSSVSKPFRPVWIMQTRKAFFSTPLNFSVPNGEGERFTENRKMNSNALNSPLRKRKSKVNLRLNRWLS